LTFCYLRYCRRSANGAYNRFLSRPWCTQTKSSWLFFFFHNVRKSCQSRNDLEPVPVRESRAS
jgi:hypothetical protein